MEDFIQFIKDFFEKVLEFLTNLPDLTIDLERFGLSQFNFLETIANLPSKKN